MASKVLLDSTYGLESVASALMSSFTKSRIAALEVNPLLFFLSWVCVTECIFTKRNFHFHFRLCAIGWCISRFTYSIVILFWISQEITGIKFSALKIVKCKRPDDVLIVEFWRKFYSLLEIIFQKEMKTFVCIWKNYTKICLIGNVHVHAMLWNCFYL